MIRLVELMVRDAVNDVLGSPTPQSHFSETKGHALSLDQGIVSISANGTTRLVPISNVKFMTPAAAAKK